MFVGQLITGGSLSVTVTVKLHVAVLPAASATSNTLVVTPTGKAEPLANPAVCVVNAPAQLSVPTGAVAVVPAASLTRNTLVVTPTGKAVPLANPPVCVVNAPSPPRRSSDLV